MKVKVSVEKAGIADVPQIHRLINDFAEKGDMLPRPLSELYENLRDFSVAREKGEVVACIALHVLWADLGEIKSLAVDRERQDAGLGRQLMEACLEEARGLGIPTIFCLTYSPEFFERFDFRRTDVMDLPRKVWGECQRCPKFPNCDETALVLSLGEGT